MDDGSGTADRRSTRSHRCSLQYPTDVTEATQQTTETHRTWQTPLDPTQSWNSVGDLGFAVVCLARSNPAAEPSDQLLELLAWIPVKDRVPTNPSFACLMREYSNSYLCENSRTSVDSIGRPGSQSRSSWSGSISRSQSEARFDELVKSSDSIPQAERTLSNPEFSRLTAEYNDAFYGK
jgi:hypothetical protein